jgi:REP element-mobilizing transposase RayT
MTRNLDFALGEYFHGYNRGVDRRIVFLDKQDYERFVKLLYICNSKNEFEYDRVFVKGQKIEFKDIERGERLVAIGSWCLMPNHFHLLLKEILEVRPSNNYSGISIFMHKLSTAYSLYFNKKYFRTGSLFEGRFKAKHLGADEYLKYQYTYIHLNPIGIIDKGWKKKQINDKEKAKKFLKEYKYSSYKDYIGEEREEGAILNKEEFPEYFSTSTDFEAMIEEWINFDGGEIEIGQEEKP